MIGSYFQNAVKGNFGEAIQKMYKQDAKDLVSHVNEAAAVEDDGAILWKSNDHYLPDDACEMLEYEGYKFSRSATRKKRENQARKEIEEYMHRDHQFSDEELFELKANFPGHTVVDAITGETIQL